MPVKVANAPASPPRAFATGRAHSNSFTESETSGPKKPDQVSVKFQWELSLFVISNCMLYLDAVPSIFARNE